LHSVIKKLKYDLDLTTNELNRYKQKEVINPHLKKSSGSRKKIFINIPFDRLERYRQEAIK